MADKKAPEANEAIQRTSDTIDLTIDIRNEILLRWNAMETTLKHFRAEFITNYLDCIDLDPDNSNALQMAKTKWQKDSLEVVELALDGMQKVVQDFIKRSENNTNIID